LVSNWPSLELKKKVDVLFGAEDLMRSPLHLFTDKNGYFLFPFDARHVGDHLSDLQNGFGREIEVGKVVQRVGEGLVGILDFPPQLVLVVVSGEVEDVTLELLLILLTQPEPVLLEVELGPRVEVFLKRRGRGHHLNNTLNLSVVPGLVQNPLFDQLLQMLGELRSDLHLGLLSDPKISSVLEVQVLLEQRVHRPLGGLNLALHLPVFLRNQFRLEFVQLLVQFRLLKIGK